MYGRSYCVIVHQENLPRRRRGIRSGTIKAPGSYICANECSLFLWRPTAIKPASTSKLPMVISPTANGIIDAPNERQPRARKAPLQRLEKVIGKKWQACPAARSNPDYSIKFYRQSKGIFKVNVAAADARRVSDPRLLARRPHAIRQVDRGRSAPLQRSPSPRAARRPLSAPRHDRRGYGRPRAVRSPWRRPPVRP